MKMYKIRDERYGIAFTDGGDFLDDSAEGGTALVNEQNGEVIKCAGYCHLEKEDGIYFVILESEDEEVPEGLIW